MRPSRREDPSRLQGGGDLEDWVDTNKRPNVGGNKWLSVVEMQEKRHRVNRRPLILRKTGFKFFLKRKYQIKDTPGWHV